MTAIRQSPWSLRFYAGIMIAIAILSQVRGGRGSWAGVLWTVALGIATCTGSRAIWWLLVVGDVLILIELLVRGHWEVALFLLVGLVLLFTPASRRFVFARDPEPSQVSGV